MRRGARIFFLLDEKTNTQCRLDGTTGVWLTSPVGLGLDYAMSYTALSLGFFAQTAQDTAAQQSPGGTVVFTTADPYSTYRDFCAFVEGAGALTLCYQPAGGDVFRRQVQLTRLTKTERGKAGWLSCPVTFAALTPWYKPTPLVVGLASVPKDAARFGAARFGSARWPAAITGDFTAEIAAGGQLVASVSLVFTGAVINPEITLVGMETGAVYGSCAVAVTLTGSDRLEYSSDLTDCHVRKITGSTVTDLMDAIAPGSEPYFTVPPEPCRLTLSGDEAPEGAASAEIRYYYRSV